MLDGRLGSRLRGCHPVAPRPLRYGPFVYRLQFRASSPVALYVKRHERPLSVKDGIGREMADQFGLQFWIPHKSQRSFTCRKSATWYRRLYFPSEGRHAVDFFARKIRRLRSGSNPRSWVPEASMLTSPIENVKVRPSVRLSVHMEKPGFHRTYFFWTFFGKSSWSNTNGQMY
jgi:hypothetical protein